MSQQTVQESPVVTASQSSWRCVQSGDREGWLALMADDVVVEDPIGEAVTNPGGTGVRGKEALAAFYDANIGPNQLTVTREETFPSSSPTEIAYILVLHTKFPNGFTATVRGVFTYRVNDEGLITNLRGYWNMDAMTFGQEDEELTRGAVVVGGSRGIGLAVAELLAAQGTGVVINGRDEAAVGDAVARIGNGAVGFAGSPADPAVADALIDSCISQFGRIDALINCAGTPEPAGSSILNVTSAQFHDLLDAHLSTAFETCRAAAPKMVAQGGGAIVNTSSFAFLGDYGGTGYPAGKGAVNGLTLAIAAELKAEGVRANVVCPGAKTRISTGPDYEAQIGDLNRRGLLDDVSAQGALDAPPPEYVAPTYAYLVSDAAKDVTGQIFIAAGGFVGRFDRPTPSILAYRDHHDSTPWSLDELDRFIHKA